jgi:hypothetical protein
MSRPRRWGVECEGALVLALTPVVDLATRTGGSIFSPCTPEWFSLSVASDRVDWDRFIPHKRSIPTSLLPSFFQIGNIGIEEAFGAQGTGPLRKGSSVDKIAHRASTHTQLVNDAQHAHPLVVQDYDFPIACLSPQPRYFGGGDFGLAAPTLVARCLGMSRCLVLLNEVGVNALEGSFGGFSQILMK